MSLRLGHPLIAQILLGLLVLLGGACKRPEVALREWRAQRVELVQTVEGMSPEEERALVAQISEGLGMTPDPAAPNGSVRVFRLMLKGGPNPDVSRGQGKTVLVSVGQGLLVGALIGSGVIVYTFTSVKITAIGTGLGGLWGLVGYGPQRFHNNQALLKEMGYLPWDFRADWEVVDQMPQLGDQRVAYRDAVALDLRPFVRPLPEGQRQPEDIRRASLRAYGEALVKALRAKG